jgi:pyruvate kinase
MIHLPHPDLIAAAVPGSRLVIGDGEVEFTVAEKRDDTLRCLVTVGGLLESRKGVNAPGVDLPISCLSEKDIVDLQLICELDFDYIALSFVRTPYDIQELRGMMVNKMRQIPVIAKIEKSEAIDNLTAIRDEADGLMVARGDLGIEMPPQELPLLQKRIIAACNEVGKPVITATQMLQSMVEHPRPTRAEASDVANAILDGTDAVMLSNETATGKYPVESVLMMKQIAENIERAFPYDQWRSRRDAYITNGNVTEAIGGASCMIAEEIDAAAIASATLSGFTAQQIARFRPRIPIVAISPSPYTQRRLALVWGVETLLVPDFADTDIMLDETANALRLSGLEAGKKVVVTAGVPFRQSGHTNLIKVHTL